MTATLERDLARATEDRAGFDQMARLLRCFAGWMQSRQSQIQLSYLIPERSGFGWYVVAKEPAFDFELNAELSEFGADLNRRGFAIHATLLPGSVSTAVPTDAIVIAASGRVTTYAE